MSDPADLTATEALRRMGTGQLTPAALLDACLARVSAREPVLRAMAFLDEAALRGTAPRPGPLHGLPLGVKDVLDTADMPTGYNSPIWSGWHPRADAAPVAWARNAGALVLGKTVTTEFATRTPGPTTNPHDPARTPGGSSSGSAAGVAAGYFPFAFGTQTAGSVIRPAAFCGVVGFKPTYGLVNRHGMKLMSESLDTVGVFARSVEDCALLVGTLSDTALNIEHASPPRIGLCWTTMRPHAAPETVALMEDAARCLSAAGATVVPFELPPAYDTLEAAHAVVMNAESARAMGWELCHHRDRLSEPLRDKLEWGLAQGGPALEAARTVFRTLQSRFAADTAGLDLLLTPAAPGEAPEGLAWTGDPAFNLLWTSLHVPCITVPAGTGPGGMPLGIQLVARRGEDRALLTHAAWAAHILETP